MHAAPRLLPAARFLVGYRTCGNQSFRFRIISPEAEAMRVKPLEVCVVESAYEIAAHYFKATGRIPDDVDFHQPLFESIARDFRAGRRNKLVLANRAIARLEKTDALELIS
jgi:hypothetical protein